MTSCRRSIFVVHAKSSSWRYIGRAMKNLWYFWHWYTPPVDIKYVHSSHKPEYFLCATTVWTVLTKPCEENFIISPGSKYHPFSSRVKTGSTCSVLNLGSRGKTQRFVNRHLPYLIVFKCFFLFSLFYYIGLVGSLSAEISAEKCFCPRRVHNSEWKIRLLDNSIWN